MLILQTGEGDELVLERKFEDVALELFEQLALGPGPGSISTGLHCLSKPFPNPSPRIFLPSSFFLSNRAFLPIFFSLFFLFII